MNLYFLKTTIDARELGDLFRKLDNEDNQDKNK